MKLLFIYFTTIRKPMDLRTVDENLTAGKYASETQFAEDVRLVWENAKTFHKVNTEISFEQGINI